MKERPILFQGAMVRALLDGSKTQTRRLCKPMNSWLEQDCREVRSVDGAPFHFLKGAEQPIERLRSPYGKPGDHLWVRESYADIGCRLTYRADLDDGAHCMVKKWKPSIHMFRADSRILLEIVSVRVERLNDCSEVDAISEGAVHLRNQAWDREHFPVWRYEFEEAVAAGRKPPIGPSPAQAYEALWESINGAGSWAANPWVWVVEFKRVMS